ncbi:MAG: thermonuclease family protein [Rhodobacteraceae bacterium]|nr:thermonuclease family protein [Paracoccaceae bacterium]
MLRAFLRFLIGTASDVHAPQKAKASYHPTPHVPAKRSTDQQAPNAKPTTDILKGKCYVIDGDTIVISGTRIRIAGIDAPELDHPWGKKAKFALIGMCKGKVVKAVIQEDVSYDRIVAKCFLPDGRDIAAELVERGLALDWPKFSGGEYRKFEPPDARKKLWRAAARQQGRLKLSDS